MQLKITASALAILFAGSVWAADHSEWLPDPELTPGVADPAVTQENAGKTICTDGWTKKIRPPASYTTGLKRKQIAQYGYANKTLRDYEEDHLISLELGGDPRDPKNLWPEIYAGQWGAHTKDGLEDHLHTLVCNGTLTLKQAQHAIATDWIKTYKKYFGEEAVR